MVCAVASFHSVFGTVHSRHLVILLYALWLHSNHLENKVSHYLVSQVVTTAQAVYDKCQTWPRGM